MTAIANNTALGRAMDVYEMANMVSLAFYAEFDWTDDTYYWVISVMIDNTLVAEDGTTGKLFKVSFELDEANKVVFQPKTEWIEVQKEYVPVGSRNIIISDEMRANKLREAMSRINVPNAAGLISSENRATATENSEFSFDEENRRFSGYGIVFNSDSEPMVLNINGRRIKVVEQITRASIADADISDVIAAYNHNFEKILARSTAGNLALEVDDTGVRYSFEVPPTSYGDDLLTNTRLGNIRGSSFTFLMDSQAGYDIQERSDGALVAIPNKITRIMELGPVVMPAYPQTTAENRSAALVKAIESHFAQREQQQEPSQISESQMADIDAKLRHNEEAAK